MVQNRGAPMGLAGLAEITDLAEPAGGATHVQGVEALVHANALRSDGCHEPLPRKPLEPRRIVLKSDFVISGFTIGTAIDEIVLIAECSVESEWDNQVRYLPL